MGTSPKEQAASSQYNQMNQIGQRFLTGDLSGGNQFKQVNPYFEQAKTDITGGTQSAENMLNQSLSTRMAGIGQSAGEGLIGAGVPAGAGRSQAYAGAFAPAIADTQGQLAGMEKFKAGSLSDLSKYQGTTLASLLEQGSQYGLQSFGQAGGAINNMKDSTEMGDILGGITSISQLAAVFSNPELLALLTGSKGGGSGGSIEQLLKMSGGNKVTGNNRFQTMTAG